MKRTVRSIHTLSALFFLGATTSLVAADWPQWRGPHRDGISQEKDLLSSWPAGGPKQLWRVNGVGGGYSTPAVAGGRLYLLGNQGAENEFVQARGAEKGEEIWTQRIGNVGKPDQRPAYPGSRSTPTVDGDVLFALGSDGDLVCLETATGKARWRKNLRSELGGRSGTWAYAESPLVDGDVLVCTPGGKESTIVALKKQSGEPVWKSAVPGGDEAGYASAIIVTVDGVKQYVQFLQKGVVGVEAASGKFLWRYDGTMKNSPANIPTPVADDRFVYSATGRGGGGLVRLAAAGGAVAAEPVYHSAKLPTAIGGAVKLGDYLYGTSGQGLLCVEFATGEEKWQARGVGAGSVCFADGCLYLHGEETGEVALVEATPEAYREKGRFSPVDPPDRGSSKAWAYPVVANGRLYIRDIDTLWCYDVRASEAGK